MNSKQLAHITCNMKEQLNFIAEQAYAEMKKDCTNYEELSNCIKSIGYERELDVIKTRLDDMYKTEIGKIKI